MAQFGHLHARDRDLMLTLDKARDILWLLKFMLVIDLCGRNFKKSWGLYHTAEIQSSLSCYQYGPGGTKMILNTDQPVLPELTQDV